MSNGNLRTQMQTAAVERLNSGTQWGKPNGFPFRPKAKGGKPLALEETNIF